MSISLSFSLLKPPLPSHTNSVSFSSSFLHGSNSSFLSKISSLSLSSPSPPPSTTTFPVIKAMRSMQGRVVCATSDKTIAVEVTRLAPHPKYKRRVRKKKKYQAHDPDNQFKVGDWVQLEKCRPISKTKTFLAVIPAARKNTPKAAEPVPAELGVRVQSQLDEGTTQ